MVLEVKGISKYFGNLAANQDINMCVERATVHAVIGENGAGKSTLMNMIAGIFEPSTGEILVNGEKKRFTSPNDAAKAGIGMVHQEFMLFSELTVLENLMMGYERKKAGLFLDKRNARQEIEEICKTYNFSIPLDEKISNLPVSLLQQVEIVKVLYKGADIIILDEPTSVLTPQGVEGLFEAIRYLTEQNKTIIMITHKLQEVLEISDSITVLKNGKVTGDLKPEDADEKKLASLMVGREILFNTVEKEKQIGKEILRVENLSIKDIHDVEKVKDFSFSIHEGEILGVAGVAGAGQAELVECLFGMRFVSSGKVCYRGKEITGLSPREHRELGIGYVPQDRLATGCSVDSTLLENCIMGYYVSHKFSPPWLVDFKKSKTFTDKVLEDFEVKYSDISQPIGSLSGGNIQKTIVGREFLQDCQLLIIEDPTRGIDVGAIEFIWQEIINISASGTSILLVSHELDEIMELSDRILVMHSGVLAADLENTKELTEETVGLYMLGGSVNGF